MPTKPKILIIGGSSFVSQNFIRLQKNNYSIKVVSRSMTGYDQEVLFPDFSDVPNDLFKNVDIVINCAAIVHQQKKIDEKIYNDINYKLPVDLASKAKTAGVKKFIQLSTIAVYGKATHIDVSTEENPINPYGGSKLKADKELSEMADNDFNVVIFRPPMIYGGKDAPGNMMRLIKFIAKGFPLPFKKLKNKRDFIHIDNLIGFIDASLKKNISGIFLVSDHSPVLIAELYSIIINSLGKANRTFRMPAIGFKMIKKVMPGMYDKLFGNLTIEIERSIQLLDYNPTPMLEKGIAEMTVNLNKQE